MKQYLCIGIFIFLKLSLNAQALFFLDSNATYLEAKVVARNIATSAVTQMTADNGKAILPSRGKYLIKAYALGYLDFTDTINVTEIPTKIILTASTQMLDAIVITGQVGIRTASRSVIPIRVIDSRKLELMGAQNLRDVLTNESGIRINQDNILGSSIVMQGLTGENIKILIDGIPVIGRQNGNIDLSQIDMSNVDHIEIAEGPLSINYGSNALGGVINIITKKGNNLKQSLALKTYYESTGTYNSGLYLNTHIKKLIISTSLKRNFFDGWSRNEPFEPIPESHLADSNRFKTWKPKTQYGAGLNLGYQTKQWYFISSHSYFNELIINRGMPRAPYFETAFDDTYNTNRIDNMFEAVYTAKNKSRFTTQLAYNSYKRIKNSYFKDLTTLDQVLTKNEGDQDTTTFHLWNIRPDYISSYRMMNYEIGADINLENASGKRLQSDRRSISDYALFGVVERTFNESLTLRAGLRGSYNSVYPAPVLPSLHLKWFINNRNIIRLSYAQGFRSPDLKELYFYFVDFNHDILGNPNLRAERSNSFNAQYNFVTLHKKTLYKVELKAFYNHVNNLITLAQVQGIEYTYVNIGLYKTLGAQTSVDLLYGNFRADLGINYTGRYNQLASSFEIEKFSFSPEFKAGITYDLIKYKTQFSLFYKYNGKLPAYVLINNEVERQYIDNYQWADFMITKTFRHNIVAGAGVKNIFNVFDISAINAGGVHGGSGTMPVGMGRYYCLTLNYTLQK